MGQGYRRYVHDTSGTDVYMGLRAGHEAPRFGFGSARCLLFKLDAAEAPLVCLWAEELKK